MIRALLVLLLLATVGVASYVLLPIERVEVVGHRHLTEAQVRKATGLELGSPWLWAWPYRLEGLRKNPWVKNVALERTDWGVVRITLSERSPVASIKRGEEVLGLSADGVYLPGAKRQNLYIEGKGSVPVANLLILAQTFPKAHRLRYDSSGYRVQGENFNVWANSVKQLQDWAKIRTIGQSDALSVGSKSAQSDSTKPAQAAAQVSSVYVYSWGVSVRR